MSIIYRESFLNHALAYASRGWPVFPLKPRGKAPLVGGGFHAATVDEERIREWWTRWPDANIGIPTSTFLVLDLDPRNSTVGGGVDDLLRWIGATYGPVPRTLTSLTGGGGKHLLFQPVEGARTTKLADGVDVKGEGGYIVVPPSVHPSGEAYRWEDETIPLAEAPAWLVERRKKIDGGGGGGDAIPKGARNETLTSIAGAMRRRGMTTEEILPSLLMINQRRCKPPLEEKEVFRIATSIGRYPAAPSEGKLDKIVEAIKASGRVIRLNELDDTVEINGVTLNDIELSKLYTELAIGKKFSRTDIRDVLNLLADQNRYHPIRDWMNGLKWDGGDHLGRLLKYVRLDTPFVLKRWLLACVDRVLNTGPVKFQTPMLVLIGAQGIGKSNFVRWLATGPGLEYYRESALDTKSKDDERSMVTKFIWEVSELGASMRRADRDALKAFITTENFTFRKPYDRCPVTKPVLCNLVGTLNPETGFLSDPTGNRRFWPVVVEGIDWAYARDIDVNQLWAQMVAMWRRRGERPMLTDKEAEIVRASQLRERVEDPLEDVIKDLFDLSDPEAKMRTADILKELDIWGHRLSNDPRMAGKRLADTLINMGLEPVRFGAHRYRGWKGIRPKSK